MKIYHVTSPENAESLLQHGVFRATSCHTDPSMSMGLHGYSFKYGYFVDQVASARGVKLILEWSGSIKHCTFHSTKPLAPNTLYIQYPWRCFIAQGSDAKKLRIVGVLPDKSGELDRYLGIERPKRWGDESAYRQYTQSKTRHYIGEFWQRCKRQPAYLSIAGKQSNEARVAASA